jgi:hypothetical protein
MFKFKNVHIQKMFKYKNVQFKKFKHKKCSNFYNVQNFLKEKDKKLKTKENHQNQEPWKKSKTERKQKIQNRKKSTNSGTYEPHPNCYARGRDTFQHARGRQIGFSERMGEEVRRLGLLD